jgi:phosphatidylserine/phosphatidylglycerophosphate/cardiolipin synthase-like enzyme
MVGSANFTTSGVQNRTEMSVFFENEPQVEEIAQWFDMVWENSSDIPVDALHELIESMPEARVDAISKVSGHNPLASRCVRHAALVPLIEPDLFTLLSRSERNVA